MAKRTESDEHYVMDLCDEALGSVGERQHYSLGYWVTYPQKPGNADGCR